jgi:hypothetical protein
MCGFLIGALVLFGVMKIAKCAWRGRGCRAGRHGRGGHRGHGGGFIRWLFEDLETTPGQERSIHEALGSFREKAREAKATFGESLDHVASAISGDELDHEAVGEAWVRQDAAIDGLRLALVEALGQIHETLDGAQRERLAELIRKVQGRGFFGDAMV